MPQLDREQRKIVRLIRKEGRKIRDPKFRKVYERAAVQTGLVESNLRNLDYGDADSQGWRQERASLYPNPTNIKASVRRFRQEFQQHYDPGEASYEVAAQVQRPAEQYRSRYKEEADEAAQILGQYGASGGGAGGGGRGGRHGRIASRPDQYKLIPGVDNAPLRQQAMLGYLEERGKPGSLLELKGSLDAAQDVPDQSVRIPGQKVVRRGGNKRNRPNQDGKTAGVAGVGGDLKELFWNGPGATNVKDGKRVPKGFVSGHTDHVHVAGGRKSVDRLGRLAQQMGLHVGENETFDPVDPVHTEGSYHYRDMAIDVSGDPKLMRKFAKRVAKIYGLS